VNIGQFSICYFTSLYPSAKPALEIFIIEAQQYSTQSKLAGLAQFQAFFRPQSYVQLYQY